MRVGGGGGGGIKGGDGGVRKRGKGYLDEHDVPDLQDVRVVHVDQRRRIPPTNPVIVQLCAPPATPRRVRAGGKDSHDSTAELEGVGIRAQQVGNRGSSGLAL